MSEQKVIKTTDIRPYKKKLVTLTNVGTEIRGPGLRKVGDCAV